jgi:hypothetical protein
MSKCAFPCCTEDVEGSYGESCSDCGASYCKGHLSEPDDQGKKQCDLCQRARKRDGPVYQYKRTQLSWCGSQELVQVLNKLGLDGWELVKMGEISSDQKVPQLTQCVFKRRW